MSYLRGSERLRPAAEGGGDWDWPSHLACGSRQPSCTRSQGSAGYNTVRSSAPHW